MKNNMASIYTELGMLVGKKITIQGVKELVAENDGLCFKNKNEKGIDFAGRKLDYIIQDESELQEYDEFGNSKSELVCFEYDGIQIKNIWTA